MSNRDELLEDDGAADDDDRSTEEKYIREGDELLESNKDILQATLQRVQDARSLGESGIEKLKRQNEQLAGISENLDQMEDTLKVSQRLLRQMARRMLTDKYLWMLMFLVVAAIIGIILVQQF
jgi:predicted Rossmann fold nucleotide-binding protein DprA/Smf involved in DNA uptake